MGANPGAISWQEVRQMAAKVAGKLARTMRAPEPFDDGGVPVIAWRPAGIRQLVWVDPFLAEEAELSAVRVHVKTVLASNVQPTARLLGWMARENRDATVCSLAWSDQTRDLCLGSAVWMVEDSPREGYAAVRAAAMQAERARRWFERPPAPAAHLLPPRTGPGAGVLPERLLEALPAPMGELPAFVGEELFRLVTDGPRAFAITARGKADAVILTHHADEDGRPAAVTRLAPVAHPEHGLGIAHRLEFPGALLDALTANQLNIDAMNFSLGGHHSGAWLAGGDGPVLAGFVPAAALYPGRLWTIVCDHEREVARVADSPAGRVAPPGRGDWDVVN